MLRFFDYIYYRQYRYIRQAGRGEYWASWSAFAWIGFVVIMTIAGLMSLIGLITRKDIMGKYLTLPIFEQLGLLFILGILCERRWGSGHKTILMKFENLKETKRQLFIRNIGIWIYVFVLAAIIITEALVTRH